MKKLTLFLTLSLLTVIGTSTLVKAEEPNPNPDDVVLPSGASIEDMEEAEASADTPPAEAAEAAEAPEAAEAAEAPETSAE